MAGFLLKRLFLLIVFICPFLVHSAEKSFVIVITSHDDKSWCQYNLDSIFEQNYRNYRIIYVSDGSTDGSDAFVEKYVRENHQEQRVTLFKNQVRKGQLACACQAIFSCKDNEIIVELNGKDWLAHREVLSTLNRIYDDPDVWMTYGQSMSYPDYSIGFAKPISEETTEGSSLRHLPDGIAHVRTFYASLFQSIKKEDFLDEGKFFQINDGRPYLIPILEMAGGHSRPISDILYVVNQSPSDTLEEPVSGAEDAFMNKIQGMAKYLPLAKLPTFPLMTDTPHGQLYRQIKDILHPTLDDYRLLHNYLFHGNRLNLDRLADIYYGQRTIRILGDEPEQVPMEGLIHVNSTEEEKENCIILFSTYNRNYPRGLKRQLNCITNSDFKGDVLYKIGGWPDEEGGSLVLSHVPYAFKACFFKQAQRLGYKRVLWMDASIVPIANLNEIFGMIQNKGYLVMGNSPFMVGPFMNPQAAAFFGLTHSETYQIPSCSAAVFGLDLTQKIGRDLLDHWHRAAQDPDAFFSSRADQNALSLLLHQYSISDFIPISRMPHTESNQPITPDSLFSLDRVYIR
ncbi:MAG: glycosyltransferase family 2 protein [Verrucomicrobia bacterium]|nr:glycosyltransferase family 2 protein [Verrucomicrobiota bacterium]